MSKFEEVMQCENEMWNSFINRDRESFLEKVLEEAVMVCGGKRITGREYADIIEFVCIDQFEINYPECVYEDDNCIQVHYVVDITVNDKEFQDMAGKFNVISGWKKNGDKWKMYFNIDSQIVE